MEAIVLIPGFISIYLCLRSGPLAAFLKCYIPTVILLPHVFWLHIPGLPDLNFQYAALLPIIPASFSISSPRQTRLMEVVVIAYCTSSAISELINSDLIFATKSLFNSILTIYFPFKLATKFLKKKRSPN